MLIGAKLNFSSSKQTLSAQKTNCSDTYKYSSVDVLWFLGQRSRIFFFPFEFSVFKQTPVPDRSVSIACCPADGSIASSEAKSKRKAASPCRKVGNSGAAKRMRSQITLDRLPQVHNIRQSTQHFCRPSCMLYEPASS